MKLPFSNAFWSSIIILLIIAVFNFVIPAYMNDQYGMGEIREFFAEEQQHNEMMAEYAKGVQQLIENRVVGKYTFAEQGSYNNSFIVKSGELEIRKDGTADWWVLIEENNQNDGGSSRIKSGGRVNRGMSSLKTIYIKPSKEASRNSVDTIRPWKNSYAFRNAVSAIRHWSDTSANPSDIAITIPKNPDDYFINVYFDSDIRWNKLAGNLNGGIYPGVPAEDSWWIGTTDCNFYQQILLPDTHVRRENSDCRFSEVDSFGETVQRYDCSSSERPAFYAKSQLACQAAIAGEASTIHTLALSGNADLLRRIIRNGADVNARDASGNTPIMLAPLSEKPTSTINLLLNHKADPSFKNKEHDAMAVALSSGLNSSDKLNIITLLLSKGVDPNTYIGNQYHFIRAIHTGSEAIVATFIKHGADINLVHPEDGSTPLMAAVQSGNSVIVKMLLEHGATLNSTNKYHETAVDMAIYYPEVMKVMLQQNSILSFSEETGSSLLKSAITSGDTEYVNLLISRKINVNNPLDRTQRLALPYAIALRQDKIAISLISAGANVNIIQEGATPLILAIVKDCGSDLIKLLISKTRDFSVKANSTFIPEMNALELSKRNQPAEITALIEMAMASKPQQKAQTVSVTQTNRFDPLANSAVKGFVANVAANECKKAKSFASLPVWTKGKQVDIMNWDFFCIKNIAPYSALKNFSQAYAPATSDDFMRFVRYGIISGIDIDKTVLIDAHSGSRDTATIERTFILSCTNRSCKVIGVSDQVLGNP